MSSLRQHIHATAVDVMGVPVHNIPVQTVLDAIQQATEQRQRLVLAYANIHAINLTFNQPDVHHFFSRFADIVFCDGYGVMLGAWLMGQRLSYRFTPPDWIDDLCALCVQQNLSLYLVGAEDGVAASAAANLQQRYPALQVAGTHHGYFDKAPDHPQNRAVVDEINAANADILIVGFGMPAQEVWLLDNHAALNPTVFIPVGAMLDYVAGARRRGPKLLTDNGLEWLTRLIGEPRRLWRRYIIGIPVFLGRALAHRAKKNAAPPATVMPPRRSPDQHLP